MLKTVFFYLLLLTTTARAIDIVYILSRKSTNLPIPVIVVTAVMVIYGAILLVKHITSNLLLKHLMYFFVIQTVMIGFNLFYVAIACPLQINFAETLIVGTFLDIIINICAIYACAKQLRSHYFTVVPATVLNRHV